MCDTCPKTRKWSPDTRSRRVQDDDEHCAMTPSREFFQTSSGARISYLAIDHRPSGCDRDRHSHPRQHKGIAGNNVVFLHGLGFNAEYWNCAMEKMSIRANVFALDFPYSGKTCGIEGGDLSSSALSSLVTEFTEYLGLCQYFLVGHGIGGIVALEHAATNPSRVVRVAVSSANPQPLPAVDPTYLYPYTPDLQQLLASGLNDDQNVCENALILANILDPFACSAAASLAPYYANSLDQYQAYQTMLQSTNIRDLLPSITSPLLIISGRDDPASPPGAAGTIRSAVDNSALVEIYQAGNNIPILHTNLFNNHVFNFFFVLSDMCCNLGETMNSCRPISCKPCLQPCAPYELDGPCYDDSCYGRDAPKRHCDVGCERERHCDEDREYHSPPRRISIPCRRI